MSYSAIYVINNMQGKRTRTHPHKADKPGIFN